MKASQPLGHSFLEALGPARAAWTGDERALDVALADLLEAARAAWPEVELPPAAFAAFVAERLAMAGAPSDLRDVRAADLYIACACARGDSRALAAFEQRYFPEVDRAVARLAKNADHDEVAQRVRERLFVGPAGDASAGPGKIAEYAGRGDLRNWLRAVAVRTVLNLVGRAPPERPMDESGWADLPDEAALDPELGHLVATYRAAFKSAFAEAAAELGARDKSLLYYAFSEHLSIDQIGTIYGVNRSTAARWLVRAKDALSGRVRRILMDRLGVAAPDYDSLVRLVRSHLDLSVERCLGASRDGVESG